MRVFAVGATGFVGRHLVEALLQRGHEVTLLRHHAAAPPGAPTVTGDIREPAGWASALTGFDAVINLVGIIREIPQRGVTFQALHIEATANILQATQAAGIRHYLHMSALGTGPDSPAAYLQTKFAAEGLVQKSGLRWTIFRPSLMFGAGAGFFETLESLVDLPFRPVIGDGGTRFQPVSVKDVATCYAIALSLEKAVGRIYEIGGPRVYTFTELLRLLAAAKGTAGRPEFHLPVAFLKTAAHFGQRLASFPLTEDQLAMLRVDNTTADVAWQEDFALQPRPLEEWLVELAGSGTKA